MPWVMKNDEGKIITFFDRNRGGNLEWVEDNDPRIAAFWAGPSPQITFTEFRNRFTADETQEIMAMINAGDLSMMAWMFFSSGAGMITLTSAEVIEGMSYLVAQGKLTEQRKAEILTP